MNQAALADGLIDYLLLVIIITFHEFGHAWMASKCGDDTARLQGRITLNPLSHIDLVGTVLLPLVAVLLSASGSNLGRFIIGWGKPVPVNLHNLRRPRLDDIWVSLAGPAMNVVIALAVMPLVHLGILVHSQMILEVCYRLALLSLFLCFFNLLPIPPLDGSHVLRNIVGMSYETYWRISQYGIFLVIVAVQIDMVQKYLSFSTAGSMSLLGWLFRLPLGRSGIAMSAALWSEPA